MSTQRRCPVALAAASLIAGMSFAAVARANSFTPGDLVVTRVGTGSAALTPNAAAVFLDEYTTAGVLVQSIALPTSSSGANVALTLTGTNGTTSKFPEGLLQLSPDGTTLSLAGYNQTPGKAISTSSSTTNRVVATVSASGIVDTTTVINSGSSLGIVRSAVTDGSKVYISSDTLGIVETTLGSAGAGTRLSTDVNSGRVVSIYDGQVYLSTRSGLINGITAVGTGEPVTSGQTDATLAGFGKDFDPYQTSSRSPYDFVFANDHTLYIADSYQSPDDGGVQKWIFDGGRWFKIYTINLSGSSAFPFQSLTGQYVGDDFVMYGINNAGQLCSITDTGTGGTSSVSVLASSAMYTAFRGVEFVPTALPGVAPAPLPSAAASMSTLGLACALLLKQRKRAARVA